MLYPTTPLSAVDRDAVIDVLLEIAFKRYFEQKQSIPQLKGYFFEQLNHYPRELVTQAQMLFFEQALDTDLKETDPAA